MNLLLLILMLQPVPVKPAPTLVITPGTVEFALTWDNSPTNWVQLGVSNRIYYWKAGGETNVFEVGQTNLCPVQVEAGVRYWYVARAVQAGVESLPSNTIKNPPDVITGVIPETSTDLTTWISGAPIARWTNAPGDPQRFYRLREQELWKDYSP